MNITGGKYNSLKVKTPESKYVRPTLSKIRQSVFNVLASETKKEGLSFLDCFSGSGIMSLEAVSRGYKKVVAIEKDIKTAKLIKDNFSYVENSPELIVGDASKILEKINEKFDVIYIDPPYEKINLYNSVLKLIVDKELLNPSGLVVVECKKDFNSLIIPKELNLLKEKTYGDTTVKFLKIL